MNNVKKLRTMTGMQQKELALLIGVSAPTVSEWENGKKNPSGERLKKLAQVFNVDAGTILGFEKIFMPIRRDAVPIVGDIACGTPITAEGNIDGFADLPEGIHADFAVRCKGDSMAPTFKDGDLVLIRQQPEVQNGQIAAVGINGETTLKHFYRSETRITLTAENPSFAPMVFSAETYDEIVIYGLAVGYTRIF